MKTVILAFKNMKAGQTVRELLSKAGYTIEALCHSAAEVRRTLYGYEKGIVVCSSTLPDMTPDNLYEIMPDGFDMLVLASDKYEFPYNTEILCLLKPIARTDLLNSVKMLNELEFNHRRKDEEKSSQKTAEDLELITKAKKVLMTRYFMDEKTAHRFIQKRSMNCGLKAAKTAEIILDFE